MIVQVATLSSNGMPNDDRVDIGDAFQLVRLLGREGQGGRLPHVFDRN